MASTPRFYNTLTHREEDFAPIDPPNVTMYNCGPTVYDYAHIGNFRAFVFADVLRRFLELIGHEVHQVMNITDVGHMTDDQLPDGGGMDKMEAAAQRIKEAKKQGAAHVQLIDDPGDPYQIAAFYTRAFIEDAKKLGIKVAFEYDDDPAKTHMPRATEHVAGMQAMIARLIENGYAYVAGDGAVYFDVQRFEKYGRLSGNTLEKLRGGAGGRVDEAAQAAKRHPADFLLWKPDPRHIMKWDSPWGEGYPGWHIECSTMALEVLSRLAGKELQTIDIHTGGEDNIFPHHECEIAQACGATGRELFARFWMHTRFLLVEGEKMSKSKGNFYTVRDVLEGKVTGRAVDPAVLRFELMKAHYRSNANFTRKSLLDSASAIAKLSDAFTLAHKESNGEEAHVDLSHPLLREFAGALGNDLNMSGALAAVFARLKEGLPNARETFGALRRINSVLRVMGFVMHAEPGEYKVTGSSADMRVDSADKVTTRKCRDLDEARARKDFATADAIRNELNEAGYEVQTTKSGTIARRKLA